MTGQHQGEFEYTECFIAFIDILGFKDAVIRSISDANVRKKITRATNFMAEPSSGTKSSRNQNPDGSWEEKSWRIQTRAFSDTVVIFMPQETGSISQLLFMVRYLHDRMLGLELTMRGAVTIGGMYWNDAWSATSPNNLANDNNPVLYERDRDQDHLITLGPGLIEAYALESECAIYPRILVGRKLVDYVEQKHIGCTPLGPYQPPDRSLMEFIRVDADGLHFLDLLHPEITRNDTERIVRKEGNGGQFTIQWERDGNTHRTVMRNVEALISSWLDRRDCPDKIRAKYEWLRTYINHVGNRTTTHMQNR